MRDANASLEKNQGVDPKKGESALLSCLRSILKGGDWSDREQLARLLQARARTHLLCFRYLRADDCDLQQEITADAVIPLLRTQEDGGLIRLPGLARELARLLETRSWPVPRERRKAEVTDSARACGGPISVPDQDDERLLLALDQLLRLRVRQELHRRWRALNPRHSRWLRNLKRAQSRLSRIRRGKIGWHWALWLEGAAPCGRRITRAEILRGLEDRLGRSTPDTVLRAMEALLEESPGSFLLLGEVIAVLIELEDSDFCHEMKRILGAAGGDDLESPGAFLERQRRMEIRRSLHGQAVALMAADRARDIRLGKSVHPEGVDSILIQAVLDDLMPHGDWPADRGGLSGALRELLPEILRDGKFQALYEHARYLRRRLLELAREMIGCL